MTHARAALPALLAALLVPALVAPAAAQGMLADTRGVYLDLLEGAWRDALDEADQAARAGESAKAAGGYHALIDYACGEGRDRLVPLRATPPPSPAPGGGEPAPRISAAAPPPAVEAAYVSLPVALRARLAALPPAGLRAYRAIVDARAGALAGAAIAARDPARLEEVVRRSLFATRGAEAATLLGDILLEQGDLVGALSSYEAAALVPDAPPGLGARRAAAARGQEAEDLRAAGEAERDPPAGAAAAYGVSVETGDASGGAGDAAGIDCPPIPFPGGVAVARPGRVVVARGVLPGVGEPGAPQVRALPAGARAGDGGAARPGAFALGGAAARGLLAVAIEHARGIFDADGDLHAGSAGPAAGPRARFAAGGGLPGLGGGAAPALHARGGVFGEAFDLFLFDIARGDRLLFTTAEAGLLGREHAEWLAQVEWTARPLLGPGVVYAAAVGRGGEPEVHAAAFDATGGRPRLRWRAFLCARAHSGASGEPDEGPPLEPALARAGNRLLVDTACGLVVALDAHRGEVVWAVRRATAATPREAAGGLGLPLRGLRAEEERVESVPRPTDAPIVVPGPRPRAVFSERAHPPAALVARDVASGEAAWTVAAESDAYPVAALEGGRLAVVEDGVLALVDGASGRRLGRPLALPAAGEDEQVAIESPCRGAAARGRILVPLAARVLVVRVDEGPGGPTLVAERALRASIGPRPAVAAWAERAAIADGLSVTLYALGAREGAAAWEDAISVAEAYGAEVPAELPGLMRGMRREAVSAGAPGATVSGTALAYADTDLRDLLADGTPGTLPDVLREGGGGAFGVDEDLPEPEEDPAAGVLRARLPGRSAGSPRVTLVLELAGGRVRVQVEPSFAGELEAR